MNPYWLKIAGGSLAIFGVGMGVLTVGKKGVSELKAAAIGPIQSVLRNPLPALAFRFEGQTIGTVKGFSVQNGGDRPEDVKFKIELTDQSAVARLKSCDLTPVGGRHDRQWSDFRCATKEEMDRLEPFGQVTFTNVGLERTVYLSPRDLRAWRRADIRELDASLDADQSRKDVKGRARYDIVNEYGKRERGTVDLQANDGGASLRVRDEHGNEIVNLTAGQQGLRFNIRDKRGREVLKLLGGNAGVALKINADSGSFQQP